MEGGRMIVTISCSALPKRNVVIDSNTLFYDADQHIFSMIRPRGDDWLQKVRSSFDFSPASVVGSQLAMTVTLDTPQQAYEFEEWLIFANQEADEGYRTMRG
jgi:hypothetical protein